MLPSYTLEQEPFDKLYLHGPMHPEFDFDDAIAEIYRAACEPTEQGDERALSQGDACRLIEQLKAAPSKAAAEDILLRNFYRGRTSPAPGEYPDPVAA